MDDSRSCLNSWGCYIICVVLWKFGFSTFKHHGKRASLSIQYGGLFTKVATKSIVQNMPRQPVCIIWGDIDETLFLYMRSGLLTKHHLLLFSRELSPCIPVWIFVDEKVSFKMMWLGRIPGWFALWSLCSVSLDAEGKHWLLRALTSRPYAYIIWLNDSRSKKTGLFFQ